MVDGALVFVGSGNSRLMLVDQDGTSMALAGTQDGALVLRTEGAPGPPGPQGPAGAGVPTGGSTGQVLVKTSNSDYATEWQTGGGGGGTGPAGPQGPVGPQGPAGPTGATGAQGPAGATGPQGPIGNTGPAGPNVPWVPLLVTVPGPAGQFEHEQSVAAAGVVPTSVIHIELAATTDDDENGAELTELASLIAIPATGSFTVILSFREQHSGPLKLQYQIW